MNAPLRLGHVLNTMGLGGVPEAARQLLARLPAQHYARHVFVLSQPDTEAAVRAERRAAFEAAGVKVDFASAGAALAQRLEEMGEWIGAHRIQVLHTHSYKPNLQARRFAAGLRSTGLRIVAHYHNQYDNKWQADGTLGLDRELAQVSDALVACSHSVADHVAQRLCLAAGRVRVVANGVDMLQFRRRPRDVARRALGLTGQGPAIGIVGRLCTQKGQDVFIDAAARLGERFPDAQWLIIGAADEGETLGRLQEQARSLGLDEPRLRFLGHCTDMPEVYGALDLLVAPSRWEGFGLMLVEAMACATPIVAARAGAIPEVVTEGRTALLVEPNDALALSEAIATVLEDPHLRSRLGEAGPSEAGRFAWQHSANQLEAIYAELFPSRVAA